MLLKPGKVIEILDEVYLSDVESIDYIGIKKMVEDKPFVTLPIINHYHHNLTGDKWDKRTYERLKKFKTVLRKCSEYIKKENQIKTVKFPPKSKILYRVVTGSTAYGLNTETSDIDMKGVYIADSRIKAMGLAPDLVEVTKDEVYYEIGFFLQLASKGDVMVMEMLFADKKFIVHQSKIFKRNILDKKDVFISKQLRYKIRGFAMKQLKKATNYNKMANWDEERVRIKLPSEFCKFVSKDFNKPIELITYLNENNLDVNDISLSKLDDFYNCYKVYRHKDKGWFRVDLNDLFTTSIPKSAEFLGILSFKHSDYAKHRREIAEFERYKKKRNEARYKSNKEHGQKFDAKNVMHTIRILMLALRVPLEGTFRIDMTEDRKFLLDVKEGRIPLKKALDLWTEKTEDLDLVYSTANLKDFVNLDEVHKIHKNIRLNNNH